MHPVANDMGRVPAKYRRAHAIHNRRAEDGAHQLFLHYGERGYLLCAMERFEQLQFIRNVEIGMA
jgi:hypothetical protein